MEIEEYNTIRAEMLQKFKRLDELLIFSITASGVLLAWFATQVDNPFWMTILVFSVVGLGITLCVFYIYGVILKQIYNQGSYLAVFHETNNSSINYHRLTRFFYALKDNSPKKLLLQEWGKDGRVAARILIILTVVNLAAPWFLHCNFIDSFTKINLCGQLLSVTIILLVYFPFLLLIIRERGSLMKTSSYVIKNMIDWSNIKTKMDENSNFLNNTIKNILEKNGE